MNLTNLFNFNFLKENIKRSKATILLLTLLVPVINVIYFLMSYANSSVTIPEIAELHPLSLIGIYIIPVLLSITLFSFIYKRKSSDFVMSLPVSKKQIFISNTLGGIVIILVMNIINYLFTLLATLIMPHVLVDYQMIFDAFILWTITYIFVFTCTNIAVSISSNKITTVVVTLLVLFLVPFTHMFITNDDFKGVSNSDISTYCDNEICKPTNYECYTSVCESKRRQGIYPYTYYEKIEKSPNYTIPFALGYESLFGDSETNVTKSILKMAFLSITYIVVGVLLFTKKKFEVVETSFKSERMHNIIRSLTTVPILCIYYVVLINSNISTSDIFTIIFLVVLLIAYIIIYDLITRKKVTNILKSIASLMIVGIIVIFTGEISKNNKVEQINVNDITKMTFIDENMVSKNGYTTDKELIGYIISIHIDNIKGEENYYRNFNVKINVDNKLYRFRISVTKSQYEHILNTLSNDKTYQKSSSKIKNKDVFAIRLEGDHSYISNSSSLYTKILKEFEESKVIRSDETNNLFTAVLSVYDNYQIKTIYYDIKDENLHEEILNHYNKEVSKTFEEDDIYIHSYQIGKFDKNNNTVSEYYFDGYYKGENLDINNFILDNLNDKVDINEEYMYIRIYTNSLYKNTNIFITNKVEELELLVEKLKQKEEEERQKYNIGDTYDKYTY